MSWIRRVTVCVLVAVLSIGSLATGAFAQQPAPPAAEVVIVDTPREPLQRQRPDVYDVGAGVVTAVKAPFNVLTCGLGGIVGGLLFVATFGSAYKATTRVIEEGCAQRWIIRGEDLRPRGAPGIIERWDDYTQPRR